MTRLRRPVALLTAFSLAAATLSPAALAAPISTEQAAQAVQDAPLQAATGASHQRLHATLARADLAAALEARGVSVDAVRARVDALTDAEAAEVLARIDAAPAGADVVGVLFSIFVILLVTDILGFTKVFPFTRSIR